MEKNNEINAIKIRQWLPEWDNIIYENTEHRRKPEPYFYCFTISAKQLSKLSRVYQRKANKPRTEDLASQRTLENERSEEISRFVVGGYPWSTLSDKRKDTEEYNDLLMPGWLPTAIIANILAPESIREGKVIDDLDLINIEVSDNKSAKLILPKGFSDDQWSPEIPPIEIIDGQHRLFAFELNKDLPDDYELPVVAFYNLDFTWQAYLFYTINIKPKKINTSLAYDLYPLLRIQDWLEKSPDGPVIYRETRAQEITEVLWSHPYSPWKDRINMLGERNTGSVTQAAFIRSLIASFIKKGTKIGGIFGSELHKNQDDVLPWDRVRQAAFIIFIWQVLEEEIKKSTADWAVNLRTIKPENSFEEIIPNSDPAFTSQYSLLATDQGVRGYLQIVNDMCYLNADILRLKKWEILELDKERFDFDEISMAVDSLKDEPVHLFIRSISKQLTLFDWRTSSTPKLTNDERLSQMVFKGSSGYKELRNQLSKLLQKSDNEDISNIAKQL